MRYQSVILTGILVVSMHAHAFLGAPTQALPIKNGRPVVAVVNREAISLDEFLRELGPAGDKARLLQGRGTQADVEVLERLVTIKLVVQEAARMGLDQVPEITKQMDVASREILREVLLARLIKNVKPNPAAVEKKFREAVREWKTASLLFQDQEAAKRARQEIASGAPFSKVAAAAVAAKKAKTDADNAYHAKKDYLPQIAEALDPLSVGQVSPVIHLPAGFVVMTVLDIRYPENAEARAEARNAVATQQQQALLKAHDEALRRQYVVIDKAVLKGLNYEAPKPGMDALLKDKRPVARIRGGATVTVADLTDYLRMQFFHGSDAARQRKEMNEKKEISLDATLGRRLLNMEAVRLGIDKTNEYRDRVKGYKESLVFDAFLQKVIVPDNKIKEDELRRYYNAHLKEYSYPEMRKIRGLAFARRAAAEAALRKLKEGADYNWLAANADGRVPKDAQALTFDGRPVTTDSMPEGVQKAVAGSKAGDLRLYSSPEGHFYVLSIQQVIAANAKPYTEVRAEIANKAYAEKLKKSVEEYAGKLRAQSKVETYLKKV